MPSSNSSSEDKPAPKEWKIPGKNPPMTKVAKWDHLFKVLLFKTADLLSQQSKLWVKYHGMAEENKNLKARVDQLEDQVEAMFEYLCQMDDGFEDAMLDTGEDPVPDVTELGEYPDPNVTDDGRPVDPDAATFIMAGVQTLAKKEDGEVECH